MCGRYAVYSNVKSVASLFAIQQSFNLLTSYNVAPTENVSVVCELPDRERVIISMRWGLIPSWQNPPKLNSALINARFEAIQTKPSFKQAIKQRRCLIIADGFYEWRTTGNTKQAYFIHRKDHKPFGIAGIWDKWVGYETAIESCCIITLQATENLAPLHDRMPAIIAEKDYSAWLNTQNQDWEEVKELITEDPHNLLGFHKVSSKINSALYKGSDCINPQE